MAAQEASAVGGRADQVERATAEATEATELARADLMDQAAVRAATQVRAATALTMVLQPPEVVAVAVVAVLIDLVSTI